MRIFVTGATGNIGSYLVPELIAAGHQVIGLYRSEEKARALAAAGAEPYRGSIAEPESLRAGAARSDGVIHLAFNHDFTRYLQSCDEDRRVIAMLAEVLAGTDRPLLVTSGTGIAQMSPGEPARENNPALSADLHPRAASEEAAREAAARGVNVSIMRLPQVHDRRSQGLVSYAIPLFREKGVCAYLDQGNQRWAAGHMRDVARLYRLAVERAEPGAHYHAVGEEGVPMRAIAEAIGQRLGLPVQSIPAAEAQSFFGWLAMFAALDMPASSAQTRAKLGWEPTGPTLLDDLAQLEL